MKDPEFVTVLKDNLVKAGEATESLEQAALAIATLAKLAKQVNVYDLLEQSAGRIERLLEDLREAREESEASAREAEDARDCARLADERVNNTRHDIEVLVDWALAAGADALDVRGRLTSAFTDDLVRTRSLARFGL